MDESTGLTSILTGGVYYIPPEDAITDRHVRIAMRVLKAYADGTLRTDLCDELDDALDEAYSAYMEDHQEDDWPNV